MKRKQQMFLFFNFSSFTSDSISTDIELLIPITIAKMVDKNQKEI